MTARPPQPRPTITVWQPYASLIMHGIKTFETRPSEPGGDARPPGSDRYPGLDLNPGDALWIHAAKRKLREGERFGPYETIEYTNGQWGLVHAGTFDRVCWLPLGQILGSVRYRGAIPIVASGEEGAIRTIEVDDDRTLWLVEPRRYPAPEPGVDPACWEAVCDAEGDFEAAVSEITDQLPLGIYTPGWSAWELVDPVRLSPGYECRGRQGIWAFTPPPGDDRCNQDSA